MTEFCTWQLDVIIHDDGFTTCNPDEPGAVIMCGAHNLCVKEYRPVICPYDINDLKHDAKKQSHSGLYVSKRSLENECSDFIPRKDNLEILLEIAKKS